MYSMYDIDIKHVILNVEKLSNPAGNFITFYNIDNLVNNYQRTFNLKLVDKRCLIEKFLLGIPVSYINIYKEDDSHCEILKGWETLLTIYDFFKDGFTIEDMNFIPSINGKKFSELPCNIKRRFMEKDLSFNVLQNNLLVDKESLKAVKEMMY